MKILTLDLAIRTGWAAGEPPADLSQLNSGSISLRAGHARQPAECMIEDHVHLGFNLAAFLEDRAFAFADDRPDLIVYEAPRGPNNDASDGAPRSAASIIMPFALAWTVVGEAKLYGVRCVKVYPQTWQPAFWGRRREKGEDSKRLTISRCEAYGYLPPGTTDDNRADAIAIWHWAQCKWGKWQPPVDFVLGQKVEVGGVA